MKIDLSGTIKSRKSLHYGKDVCYGITKANGDKFQIYLSELALKDKYIFSETMLHELLHLWFFIVNTAVLRQVSEDEQHEILDQAIPIILSRTAIVLKRREKSNEKVKK